ncbi:MAG: transglycosylase SLT domain-containing protein [Haemophilus parahaemolyticus]|uniref:transglycosylase SLT domain-containing protein n=1 Tax=Haemophilus parahaemolyticus TaxID=735 RepID=UPI0026EC84D7|nr:transglycosylase SLT domain-containing protein [Haemophilus parahaemolyticus]MBS6009437.1 transglycosylase SLT domain-containing protein [Haemophilus parahaemolyticus]
MWKKSYLALCLATPLVWANNPKPHASTETQNILAINIADGERVWKQNQQFEQQTRLMQRNNFLQLEGLLKASEQQKYLSPNILALVHQLQTTLIGYSLYEDSQWALVRAKIKANMLSDDELQQFITQHHNIAKRNQLVQRPFETLYQQQKWAELLAYGKTVSATSVLNQCRLFSAQFQLLADQLQVNPEAVQANQTADPRSEEMDKLLAKFEQFWQGNNPENNDFWQTPSNVEPNYWKTNGQLPSECAGIEAYWRDQGLRTAEKIRQKAVNFFYLDAKQGLANLFVQTKDPELQTWLVAVQTLQSNPNSLQNFAETQPLTAKNKQLVLASFPKWLKTLSEQMPNPNFALYQQWADKWQLSADEVRDWKIGFISRLFDHSDPSFQLWRDEQLQDLKADNLTERRLRMAILQQSDLKPWLVLLSNEGKNKAEWRYWQAKTLPKEAQRKALAVLSKERGFYSMLAAKQLGQTYQVEMPTVAPLTDLQKLQWKQPLDRIAELRELNRVVQAKTAWIELLQAVNFEEKLALSQFALAQNWYDLAVEGTIQAKAWDYIPLRLPNAYADWFAMNLQGKPITQTFAMAISRQESAWNPQAHSHANAIGLMQMLPSTASNTAKVNELVYTGERDLTEPFRNIMLGTAHLVELNEKYPQNRILIASSYNAGANRVIRWLERAGGRLAMDEFIASIPFFETRGYVQNVLTYDYYYQLLQGVEKPMMFTPEEWGRKY